MLTATDALVIRAVDHGENDRLLTLLTKEGRRNVVVKGARSLKNKYLSLCEPYVYGNFEIEERAGFAWLHGGSSYEMFYGLREDVEKLFLAAYLCDVVYEVTGTDVPAEDILRLTLNALYALVRDLCPKEKILSVFSWRVAALSGYLPDLSACAACGKEGEGYCLDVGGGALVCASCRDHRPAAGANERGLSPLLPVSASLLAALRYTAHAPIEKVFSFRLSSPEDCTAFAATAETYLSYHLERGFDSLELYRSVSTEKEKEVW